MKPISACVLQAEVTEKSFSPMTITFKKGREGRADTVSYTRADGSMEWMNCGFYVQHDLMHYAVEHTLGYTEAFFGLLAQGWTLRDFEEPKPVMARMPDQAVWAEALVNALAVQLRAGTTDEEFDESVARSCQQHDRPLPTVSTEQKAALRAELERLIHAWDALPPNGKLELIFTETVPFFL